MPNRIIKESALDSEDLSALSNGAERLFWRLTLVADDFGRFDGAPQVIKARCFPRLVDKLRTSEIETWMKELEPKLVRFYVANGRPYGYFLNWLKHQQQRAKVSKFPDPPPLDSACNQLQSKVLVSEIESESENVFEIENDKKAQAPVFALPDWIPEKEWEEFKASRKRKRALLTDEIANRIIAVVGRLRAAGHDPAEVLAQAVDRNWISIEFDWVHKPGTGAPIKTIEPKGFAAIREVLRRENKS